MRCTLFDIAKHWNCRGYYGTDSTAPNSSRVRWQTREETWLLSGRLEMIDSWTKKSANGKTVTFKIEGDRKYGFVYSARVDGRDIKEITGSLKMLTREDVETMFVNYAAGK